MTGNIPQVGWTNLDDSDEIPNWPTILTQGLTDIYNSFYLPPNKSASDDPTTYPRGFSMMALDANSASSGGWPGGSGTVVSFHRIGFNDSYTVQMYFAMTGATPDVFLRGGTLSAGWNAWYKFATAAV